MTIPPTPSDRSPLKRVPSNIRLGRVLSVDTTAGALDLQWLDHRGGRVNVPITLSDWGMYAPPPIGAIILCVTDIQDQAKIVRTVALGYKVHTSTENSSEDASRIPPILPGEKLFYAVGGMGDNKEEGGCFLHLTNMGDMHLRTYLGSTLSIYRDDQLIHLDSLLALLDTAAGTLYMGPIRRREDPANPQSQWVTLYKEGEERTELSLRINETTQGITGEENLQSPLFEVVFGSKVSSSGEIAVSDAGAEIAHEMTLLRDGSTAIRIQWDKSGNSYFLQVGDAKLTIEGDVTLQVNGNITATIGGDTKVLTDGLTHIEGDTVSIVGSGGSNGLSEVVRFKELNELFSLVQEMANLLVSHIHPTPNGPSSPSVELANLMTTISNTKSTLQNMQSSIAVTSSGQ